MICYTSDLHSIGCLIDYLKSKENKTYLSGTYPDETIDIVILSIKRRISWKYRILNIFAYHLKKDKNKLTCRFMMIFDNPKKNYFLSVA